MKNKRLFTLVVSICLILALVALPSASNCAPKGKPIHFGYLEPMTGIFASLGLAMLDGTRMAVEDVNAQGGILGRPVKVYYRDSEGSTKVIAERARRLILEKGVIMVHGECSTGVTTALAATATKHGVIHLNSELDALSPLANMSKYTIRLTPHLPSVTRSIARFVKEKHPELKTWAILVPDYAWGHEGAKLFTEAMEGIGAKAVEVVHPLGAGDFSPYIMKILDMKPDGLFSLAWSGDMIAFIKQSKPYGLYDKVFGFHYGHVVDICATLGKNMVPIWASLGDAYPLGPDTIEWSKKFNERMGYWPKSVYAGNYYDSIFIMKAAMEKAKSTEPDKIAKAFRGLRFKGIAGGPLYIRPESQLPEKEFVYLGHLAPNPKDSPPYFVADEIVKYPFAEVGITDEEARNYGCKFPFK